MKNPNTLLIGQALQLRDKLVAKRHVIPSSMMSEWTQLRKQTEEFDANHPFDTAVKGQTFTKPSAFNGSDSQLNDLVTSLKAFDQKVNLKAVAH